MRRLPFRATLFALLLLGLPALAASPTSQFLYQGSVFKPALLQVDGRTVISLEDPAVKKLISLSLSQLQWSSTGQTLYVFTPGRQTTWTGDSATVTVNGKQVSAPGRLFVTTASPTMEPAALFYALGLVPSPGAHGTRLLPEVTAVEAQSEPDGLTAVVVHASSPVRPRISRPEPGVTRLQLADVVWDAGPRAFSCGPVRVEVSGGTAHGDALRLDLRYPRNWRGRVVADTMLNEVKLVQRPVFPVLEQAPDAILGKLSVASLPQGRSLVLKLNRPFRYFWTYDPASRLLTVEIPHARAAAGVKSVDLLEQQQLVTLSADPYPVLCLRGELPPGETYRFSQLDGVPGSLVVGLVPQGQKKPLAFGDAATQGYRLTRGTIVIDPGHGGSDPGCINRRLGLEEKVITLEISKKLARALRARGWRVVLTRTTDRDVTYPGSPDKVELMARSAIANQLHADAFISIHCNASYSSGRGGSSIHWWKAKDYQLARSLQLTLGHSLGMGPSRLVRSRFVVLRYARMPAVLVETAYLTNPSEAVRLDDPHFQRLIAQQLAGGLASYMVGRYASAGTVRP